MTTPDRLPHDPFAAEPYRSDPYREWDAAYVLGALSPVERREFETHLATCSGCQAAVAELAGMPGLLAQVSPDDAAAMVQSTENQPAQLTAGEGPETPMPTSLTLPARQLDHRRRRLVGAVIALAAAFVLLAGFVGVAAVRGAFPISRTSTSAPFRLAFSPVVPSGILAVVDVVPVATGTELHVQCQYADDDPTLWSGRGSYAIWVKDRAGKTTEVKTWTARPNHLMTPDAVSALPVSKIASVEIRQADSAQTLLEAKLP
jgi:hypothetical protein